MKTFDLGIYDIIVTVNNGAGTINSSLLDGENNDESGDIEYEAGINSIESLILAHACAGINIGSEEYICGVQVAIETITNKYL